MCDCTSEEDDKPKIKSIDNNANSCDCTSEDSNQSKIECYNVPTISIGKLKSNKIDSCDCTSDDDSNSNDTTTKSCDCTSESDKKSIVCDENNVDQVDSKPPFAILQVELSKSVLDLLSSSSDSSTSVSNSKIKCINTHKVKSYTSFFFLCFHSSAIVRQVRQKTLVAIQRV